MDTLFSLSDMLFHLCPLLNDCLCADDVTFRSLEEASILNSTFGLPVVNGHLQVSSPST